MAIPAIAGTVEHAETSSSSGFTATEPAGASSGEVMVFVFIVAQDASGLALATPGDWTVLYQETSLDTGSSGMFARVYVTRRGSSAPDYTVVWTNNAYYEYALFRVSGASSDGFPIDCWAYGDNLVGNGTDAQGPSIRTQVADDLIITVLMQWAGYAGSPPADYTDVLSGSDLAIARRDMGTISLQERQVWSGSGSSNLAKLTFTFAIRSVAAAGTAGNCVSFNPINGDVGIQRTTTIPSPGSFTWCGWIKIPDYGNYGCIFAMELDGSTDQYLFFEWDGQQDLYLITKTALFEGSIKTDVWIDGRTGWHFCAVWGTATERGVTFLAEGETELTTVSSTWNLVSFVPDIMSMGTEENYLPSINFEAIMCGVCIYDVSLTRAEILAQSRAADFMPVRTANLVFANSMQASNEAQEDQSSTGEDFTPQAYTPSTMVGGAPTVVPAPPPLMLPYGTYASAWTFISTEEKGFPQAVIDGNEETRWVSSDGFPSWVAIDLGATSSVSEVQVDWEAAYGTEYSVETSDDGTSWTEIHSTTSGAGGLEVISGLSGSGRFLRVLVEDSAVPPFTSVWEMRVYGTAGAVPALPRVGASASNSNEGATALAIDGDNNTRWGSDGGADQWLYVDLGSVKSIDSIAVVWEADANCLVQVSDNASSWTTVTTAPYSVMPPVGMGASGRYLRLYATAVKLDPYFSIYELHVLGPQEVPTPPGAATLNEEAAFLSFAF